MRKGADEQMEATVKRERFLLGTGRMTQGQRSVGVCPVYTRDASRGARLHISGAPHPLSPIRDPEYMLLRRKEDHSGELYLHIIVFRN